MKLFTNEQEVSDAKAKDAVLRYLFAYNAKIFKVGDEKRTLTIFRKTDKYQPKKGENELENAIRNVYKNSDHEYAAKILEELLKFDYVDRESSGDDLFLYGLTRTGILFISTTGFEKELTEKRRLGNENFYKWLTLLIALSAILFPVLFDSTNQLVKPMNEIKVSLDSLNQNLKSLREPVQESIAPDTSIVK